MKCPFCNHNGLKVIDKRPSTKISIRRRRECLKCKRRFTTYENIPSITTRVVKKDNTREQFNRQKILTGLFKAFEKRPVTTNEIEQAVNGIENELRINDTKEIHSKILGEMVMNKIKELDKVAYVRFASVYKDFHDINDFKKEINKIKRG